MDRAAYAGPNDIIAFGAQQAEGTYGLYVVTPEDPDPRLVVAESAPLLSPVWSPDGLRIAYAVAEGEAAQVRIVELESGAATTIAEADVPPSIAWSPDANRLAYADGTLHVYDVEGGAPIDVPEIDAGELDWSPNADELIVVADGGLVLVSLDDGGAGEAQDGGGSVGGPRWSPDGGRIAFSGGSESDPRLFVSKPGDEASELGAGSGPIWSPSGDQIAYLSVPAQEGPTNDLYVIDADGGEPRRLTESITRESSPTWSPGGSRIAYLAEADAQTSFLCIVILETAAGDCLDLAGLRPLSLAWSPE